MAWSAVPQPTAPASKIWILISVIGSCGLSVERFLFFSFWCNSPQWAKASSFTRFSDRTQRRTTGGGTPLDEWSARRRDLYPTTHTTLTTDKHPCPGGFRTHNLSRRAAADLRLRPRGHWDRRRAMRLRILQKKGISLPDVFWFVPRQWHKQQIFSVSCPGTENGTLTYYLPGLCN